MHLRPLRVVLWLAVGKCLLSSDQVNSVLLLEQLHFLLLTLLQADHMGLGLLRAPTVRMTDPVVRAIILLLRHTVQQVQLTRLRALLIHLPARPIHPLVLLIRRRLLRIVQQVQPIRLHRLPTARQVQHTHQLHRPTARPVRLIHLHRQLTVLLVRLIRQLRQLTVLQVRPIHQLLQLTALQVRPIHQLHLLTVQRVRHTAQLHLRTVQQVQRTRQRRLHTRQLRLRTALQAGTKPLGLFENLTRRLKIILVIDKYNIDFNLMNNSFC